MGKGGYFRGNFFPFQNLMNVFFQDPVLLKFNADWHRKHRIVAWARDKLRMQGITGLSESVCLRVLLERLPNIMQEQYNYEKVRDGIFTHLIFYLLIRCITCHPYELLHVPLEIFR